MINTFSFLISEIDFVTLEYCINLNIALIRDYTKYANRCRKTNKRNEKVDLCNMRNFK